MKRIVISQPMFLPWVGLFEQIRLADVYVHYDDVQFIKRSFMNRVQIKTPEGSQWLTAPVVQGVRMINEVLFHTLKWPEKHLRTFQRYYSQAPFFKDMMGLAEPIYSGPTANLAEFNIFAIEKIALWLGLKPTFLRSSALNSRGSSSERLLNLVLELGGTTYLTGHGARNYLDHELFEANAIRVEYIDYQRTRYPQPHGDFDPHVTVLDLIANVGHQAAQWVHSPTKYWKDFIN